MLTFTVKVLFVQDEKRTLPIKDKNGVPTQLTREYRFVTIQAMAKDNEMKIDRPVVIKAVDPQNFTLPKAGETFTTPEVRQYQLDNGVPVISI